MKYRYARVDDLADLTPLLAQLDMAQGQCRTERQSLSLDSFLHEDDARMIIATDEQRIAGFVTYRKNIRGNGWIVGVGAHPDYRGQGITDRLMQEATQALFKQHPRIIVRTASTNTGAQSLFERSGFKPFRTYKQKNPDGSDEVWFEKKK